jgi:hypothetical protein
MTRNPRPARPRALFWAGVTLVALWNAGLIALAVDLAQEYRRCVAGDGIVCFDFSGPIVVVMIAVDEVVALTVWFVRRRPARRRDPPD